MLANQATVVIDRPPEVILEWIGDLERYRRADRKIGKVLHQGEGTVRYRGRLRGIPTPSDTNVVTLDPGRSLTFAGAPGVWVRRILDFEGGFTFRPVEGGTAVTHHESLGFKPAPLRVVAEALLRRWLAADLDAEVGRLKALVEAET